MEMEFDITKDIVFVAEAYFIMGAVERVFSTDKQAVQKWADEQHANPLVNRIRYRHFAGLEMLYVQDRIGEPDETGGMEEI